MEKDIIFETIKIFEREKMTIEDKILFLKLKVIEAIRVNDEKKVLIFQKMIEDLENEKEHKSND